MLIAILALGSLVGVAEAHKFVSPSASTIRYREASGTFQGRVESDRDRCERRRFIKVVHRTADGREVVGKTRSNKRGRWKVAVGNANGIYRAIVKRRANTAGPDTQQHSHICERGRSPEIAVVNP
jgi:hypothetical protein